MSRSFMMRIGGWIFAIASFVPFFFGRWDGNAFDEYFIVAFVLFVGAEIVERMEAWEEGEEAENEDRD